MKKLTLLLFLVFSINIFAQDGTLDPSFGVDGIVELEGQDDWILQYKLIDNNKSLLLVSKEGIESLLKINEDGSYDETFGENGRVNLMQFVTSAEGTFFHFKDFDESTDGKITVGGNIRWDGEQTSEHKAIVIQLNANGELNTAFGTNGIVEKTLQHQGNLGVLTDGTGRIKVTLNNKIIVSIADASNPNSPTTFFPSIWKLNSDGTTDLSFGEEGIFEFENQTYGKNVFDVDNTGNIFLADRDFIAKLYSTGVLDRNFGVEGFYIDSEASFKDVGFQSDGKIIATLYAARGNDEFHEVMRLNTDGTLDDTFGENGIRWIYLLEESRDRKIIKTSVDVGDEIISGGYFSVYSDGVYHDYAISLIKLTPDGNFKENFGENGIVEMDLYEGSEERAMGFVVHPVNHAITVSAIRTTPEDNTSILFARFLNTRTFSTITVSGDVSGLWYTDSVYVDGDIVVPLNETLTIIPGTKVFFKGEYNMDVYGTLLARGTENDNVYFFSDTLRGTTTYPYSEGFWYGITFHSTDENGQTSSVLDYCDIKYAFGRWVDEASPSFNRSFGGGLIFYKSTINVSNTKLTACKNAHNKGGVISSIYSSGTLNNVTMYRAGSITLLDSEVNIDGLNVTEGFGLYAENSPGLMKNSKIDQNVNYTNYGTVHFQNSDFQLENCEIIDNYDDAIRAESSTLTINHTLIKGNGGVGAYFIESPSTITDCEILENGNDGLWFNSETQWQTIFTSTIQNSVIAKNRGAGLRFYANNNGNIINTTIADNENFGDSRAGIKVMDAVVNVKNSIVYNNGTNLDYQTSGNFTYSIVQGNYVGDNVANTNFQNVDPLFRDAENGDYHLQSIVCGDAANSPGIDSGDPTIADLVLDCETAGLGTYSSDIGAYGGANNRWDNDVLPLCSFSGEVSGVWDCETITIEGDITILEGDTLEITEAVDWVLIPGPYQIKVEGVLLARGPENEVTDLGSNHIKFQGSDWRGIVFSSTNDRDVGTSIIENCRFDYANRLDAPNSNGGALLIYHSDNVIVKQSVFYANAGRLGGAVYLENSDAHFEDCYFQLNGKEVGQTAGAITTAGGAMYIKNSNPYLHKLQFLDNYSISGGGAMILDNSSPIISNILMARNFSGGLGGAMQCFNGSSPTIVNMTSAENIAEIAGGSFYLNTDSNPTIINSIMYGSSKPEIYLDGGTPEVTYSIIDGASSESYFGEGCLDENPYFATGTNYKLSNNNCSYSDGNTVVSPAIDAGHPDSLDLVLDCYQGLGTQRADMGYYGGGLSTIHVGTVELDAHTFNIYPNPTRNTVTLDLSMENIGDFRYSVYNLFGQMLKQSNVLRTNRVTIDLSDYKAGIYFIKVEIEDEVYMRQIIKQ